MQQKHLDGCEMWNSGQLETFDLEQNSAWLWKIQQAKNKLNNEN